MRRLPWGDLDIGGPVAHVSSGQKSGPLKTSEPVSDGTNCLRVPEAGHEPAIHDGEDRPLGLHRGVRGLI